MVSALTQGLGSGGPVAEHAHAGWLVPAAADVAATVRAGDGPHGPSHGLRGDGSDNLVVRQVGAVEAAGGDDIAPTVTSKFAKGTGGYAGMTEHRSLIVGVDTYNGDTTGEIAHTLRDGHHDGIPGVVTVVGDGGTDVSHPVTASGTDGMGRGVPAIAYAVDKERGIPNPDGIRVEEIDVAPTITADGDPAEQNDRGTRIVQSYVPDEAAPLTAGSHSPGVRPPGRRKEDDSNLVAATFTEGKTGQALADELAPTIQATQPAEGSSRQTAVVTFRKARRAQTNTDDETWQEDDYANTLNVFDGGDTRATSIIVEDEPTVTDFYGNDSASGDGVTPPMRAAAAKGAAPVLTTNAAVRRLTPRECERLQGFPDDWTLVPDAKGKPASDSPRYKQLGNAVCANVSEWLAYRIANYDDPNQSNG